MKEEVLNLKFAKHYYDKEHKFLEQVWENESEEMENEDFKSAMLAYVGLYSKYDINYVLVDSRKMGFVVTPELQDWVNMNVLSALIPYVKKIAFLMPSDIFEQVAIQQAMEEQKDELPIQAKYFDSDEDAKNWIAE